MQARSPVRSILELHKNKNCTVFSCNVGGGGGVHVSGCRGLFRVSERGSVM